MKTKDFYLIIQHDLTNYFIPFVLSLIIFLPFLVLNSDAESYNVTPVPLIGPVTVSDLLNNQTLSSYIQQGAESNMATPILPIGTVTVSDLPDTQAYNQTFVIPYLVKDPELYAEMKSQYRISQTYETFSIKSFEITSQIPYIQDVSNPSVPDTPLQIMGGFSGLSRNEAGGAYPPDVEMAVGPNHVVELVNVGGRTWTKAGAQVDNFSLSLFFKTFPPFTLNTHYPGDPKIMFDAISDRWFATAHVPAIDTVALAVSTTSDPTEPWHVYHIQYPDTICPDQPKIGITDDKFVIATNDYTNRCQFPTSFVGNHLKLFDKSQLLAGSGLTIQDFPADGTKFAVTPAQSLSSTNTLYMVEETFSNVRLDTIIGTVPGAILSSQTFPILTAFEPPDGRQPGGTDFINTGDNRIQDAKWMQGNLWLSLNDGCVPPGDSFFRSCIHLTEIDTTTPTVTQDFRISLNSYDFFYPAIAIDESEGLGIIFGYSSSIAYPSLAIATKPEYFAANTIDQINSVVDGLEINEDGRYGDYFGAAVDPSDPTTLWAAGQYHIIDGGLFSTSLWSTWITSFTLNARPMADSGPDNIVDERTLVTLDGSDSSDPNSDSLTYSWVQNSGPSVTLNNPTSVGPTFTSPSVATDTVISFALTVNDGIVDSNNSNLVSITVQNIDCDVPSSGDWIVTTSCILSNSATVAGNVLVQNNSVVTIPSGVTLDINFVTKNLTVKSGSGVLVESGGTIT